MVGVLPNRAWHDQYDLFNIRARARRGSQRHISGYARMACAKWLDLQSDRFPLPRHSARLECALDVRGLALAPAARTPTVLPEPAAPLDPYAVDERGRIFCRGQPDC